MSDSKKKTTSRRDSSSSTSNTMSKNELYTPLMAYDQDEKTTEHPSLYMSNRKSGVPNSLRESSLVEFWQRVSIDYHRNATYHDATNNSSRPLSKKDVEDRIRQRALTLTGGGFSTSLGQGGNKKKKRAIKSQRPAGTKSKRQMKKIIVASRIESKSMESNHSTKSGAFKSPSSEKGKVWSTEVLQKLNRMWIKYAQSLLPPRPEREPFSIQDYSKSLSNGSYSRSMAAAELVGAKVEVTGCAAHPSLVGKSGIVVETPKTCWKVAIFRTQEKMAASQSSVTSWKVCIVPKLNSKLAIRVPLPACTGHSVVVTIYGCSTA